jgi:hypothetical protein
MTSGEFRLANHHRYSHATPTHSMTDSNTTIHQPGAGGHQDTGAGK